MKGLIYSVMLIFFLFTFFVLFLSSIGISIFSFWQNALVYFITFGNGAFFTRIIFAIINILFLSLFLYLIKLEFFPSFLSEITLIKNDEGKVEINQKAILDIVEQQIKKFPFIKYLKPYIVPLRNSEGFKLILKGEFISKDSNFSDLHDKALLVSSKVREFLFETVGTEIKEVDITIEGIKYEFKEEEQEGE